MWLAEIVDSGTSLTLYVNEFTCNELFFNLQFWVIECTASKPFKRADRVL